MLHSLQNAWQIRYYQQNISVDLFDADRKAYHTNRFQQISVQATQSNTDKARLEFANDNMRTYLTNIHQEFTDVWVQFDALQMQQGLLFVGVFGMLLFVLSDAIPVDEYKRIFSTNRCCIVYAINFIAAVFGYFFYSEIGSSSSIQGVFMTTSIFNILAIAMCCTEEFGTIADVWFNRKNIVFDTVIRMLIFFVPAACLSNSFIVQEQHVLSYVLSGLLCLMMYNIQRTHARFDGKGKIKLLNIFNSIYMKLILLTLFGLLLIRASYGLFRCREEQGNCTEFAAITSYFIGDKLQSNSKPGGQFSDIRPVAVLAFFVTIIRMHLKNMENLKGWNLCTLIANYGSVLMAACIGSHFILSRTPMHGIKQSRIDSLAWVIYLLIALQIIALVWDPLMVHVRELFDRQSTPMIYQSLRQRLNRQPEPELNSVRIPWTYGLTAAYSAPFISTGFFLAMLIAILLGPVASAGIVITFTLATIIVLLSSLQRFQTGYTIGKFYIINLTNIIFSKLHIGAEDCIQPQLIALGAWSILAQYSFYATSHQPTLSQINWHAAFVGRLSIPEPHNHFISAILVLLNTFGGLILIYFLYPLLCVFGSGFYAQYQWLIPEPYQYLALKTLKIKPLIEKDDGKDLSNCEIVVRNFDLRRGDLNLFEKKLSLIGHVFKVGCQLISYQALRVSTI